MQSLRIAVISIVDVGDMEAVGTTGKGQRHGLTMTAYRHRTNIARRLWFTPNNLPRHSCLDFSGPLGRSFLMQSASMIKVPETE